MTIDIQEYTLFAGLIISQFAELFPGVSAWWEIQTPSNKRYLIVLFAILGGLGHMVLTNQVAFNAEALAQLVIDSLLIWTSSQVAHGYLNKWKSG